MFNEIQYLQPNFFVRNVSSENCKTLGVVMKKLNSNFVMSDFLTEYEEKWEYLKKNMLLEIMIECNRCKSCLVCCFKTLHEYNFYSEVYKNGFKMIKNCADVVSGTSSMRTYI